MDNAFEPADELGFPDDPEFRAAFVGYLEWGTRLAALNSQDGVPRPPTRPCHAGTGDRLAGRIRRGDAVLSFSARSETTEQ